MTFRAFSIAILALAGAVATMVPAAHAEGVRVRGTIASLDGSTLAVKTREGPTEAIKLAADWQVSGVAGASADDIKPGDFLGIASLPRAEGGDGALEIVIFPAALKGAGEGSRPWDLEPGSTMTNGTVTKVDGRKLTLSFSGQERDISIPDGIPVVTFAAATVADLKPGAAVFILAERDADGALTAGRVVVGTNGVAPPM